MRWPRRQPPRTPTAWSLRRRLLWVVMGTSMGLWAVSLAVVIGVAWFTTSEVLDDALDEGARLVLQLGTGEGRPAPAAPGLRSARGQPLNLRMYYQLLAPDGRVLQRADDAPRIPFLAPGALVDKGYANVRVDGEFWRVRVRRGDHGLHAVVGQPLDDRLDLLEDLATNLAWPAVAMLGVLALLTWLSIRRLLRPLDRTAAAIAAKSPQDLSTVAQEGAPRELQPILDAFNALMARLSAALDGERRFTADAAHELRTPLAAVRMRAQLIERQLGAPAPELRQLRDDVDRCTSLVESLLTLARLDPQRGAPARQAVDLAPLVDALDLHAVARAQGAHLTLALAVPQVSAEPALLGSALRNLVDNAARHGASGGQVRIESTRRADGSVRIAVRDDGPGVPPQERARLGERFFRVLGTGATGNGLGLSIVARIAELHGAVLAFEAGLDGRGLGVVLDFPPG